MMALTSYLAFNLRIIVGVINVGFFGSYICHVLNITFWKKDSWKFRRLSIKRDPQNGFCSLLKITDFFLRDKKGVTKLALVYLQVIREVNWATSKMAVDIF